MVAAAVFTFNDGLLFSTNTASVLDVATLQSSGDLIDFGSGGVTIGHRRHHQQH